MLNNKNIMLTLNKQSMEIIQRNKKLLVFPVINSIFTLCLFLIAFIPLVKMEAAAWETNYVSGKTYLIFFVIIIGYFFVFHLANIAFNAALTICALKYLEKKPYTIAAGFKAIGKNALRIFYWEIIMTTIGPAIRLMEYWQDNWSSTSKIAKQYLSQLPFMTGTLFILPVLVAENLGPFRSIQRSSQLIVARWGSAAAFRNRISFKLGLMRALSLLPLLIALIIGGKIVMLASSLLSLFLFSSASALYSASQIILINALYLYAIDTDTAAHFDVELLKNAL